MITDECVREIENRNIPDFQDTYCLYLQYNFQQCLCINFDIFLSNIHIIF